MASGLILVNKPKGLTSFDVVNKLKKQLHAKKIGHTGTLDPLATGLLVVCVDEATKLVSYLENDDKVYEAEILFGKLSDTYDIDGKIIDQKQPNVTTCQIEEVLNSFVGEIIQTPPLYSAIKVSGKPLYDYARKNKEVEIPKRTVSIYDYKWDRQIIKVDENSLLINVTFHVSKGTYIRSLANDIGLKLNTYGLINNLKRIKCGKFDLKDAYKLEDINEFTPLIKMVDCLEGNNIELNNKPFFYKLISNGVKLTIEEVKKEFNCENQQLIFVNNGELLAIYEKNEKEYVVKRVWK